MNKQAMIKLAQVRLAINYVLRNRMQKQAGGLSRLGYDAAKFYGGAGLAGLRELDDKYNVMANAKNLWNRGVVNTLSAPYNKANRAWQANYNKAFDQAFPIDTVLDSINDPAEAKKQRDWHNNYMKQNPMPPSSPYNNWWIR